MGFLDNEVDTTPEFRDFPISQKTHYKLYTKLTSKYNCYYLFWAVLKVLYM
jgi:hypothetical protein